MIKKVNLTGNDLSGAFEENSLFPNLSSVRHHIIGSKTEPCSNEAAPGCSVDSFDGGLRGCTRSQTWKERHLGLRGDLLSAVAGFAAC